MTAPLVGRWLDDYRVGERVVTRGITLTRDLIVEFAQLYDPQTIHMDIEGARAAHHGDVIASGVQTWALATRLFIESGFFAGCYIGGTGMDELRWPKPVHPGDTIHSEIEVAEVRPSRSKPDRGLVRTHHRVLNQRGEPVMSFYVNHIIARRPGTARADSDQGATRAAGA